ncbi:MAG: hypothetical protein II912_00905 [Clostridia bacterium]|nr:hypothetical protein [Clostridia bacterium]
MKRTNHGMTDDRLDALIRRALKEAERREKQGILEGEACQPAPAEKARAYRLFEAKRRAEEERALRAKNRRCRRKKARRAAALCAAAAAVLALLWGAVPDRGGETDLTWDGAVTAAATTAPAAYVPSAPETDVPPGQDVQEETPVPPFTPEPAAKPTPTSVAVRTPEPTPTPTPVPSPEPTPTPEPAEEPAPEAAQEQSIDTPLEFYIENRSHKFTEMYLYPGARKCNDRPVNYGDTVTVRVSEEDLIADNVWYFTVPQEQYVAPEYAYKSNGFKLKEVLGKTLVLTRKSEATMGTAIRYWLTVKESASDEKDEAEEAAFRREILGENCFRVENHTGLSILELYLGHNGNLYLSLLNGWLYDGQWHTAQINPAYSGVSGPFLLRISLRAQHTSMQYYDNPAVESYDWKLDSLDALRGGTLIFELDENGRPVFRIL